MFTGPQHSATGCCKMRLMLKRLAISAGIALLVAPLFSLAQSTNQCPLLTRSLARGSKGQDVLALQKFLNNDGDLLSDYVTGYFGTFTQQAVTQWQLDAHIISSAKDSGAGNVGPRTRAAIAKVCPASSSSTGSGSSSGAGGSTTSTSGTTSSGIGLNQCPLNPQPTSACLTGWFAVTRQNGCVSYWTCSATTSGSTGTSTSATTTTAYRGPALTSVSGPRSLTPGTTGIWTINATDTANSALYYGFGWGDEGTSINAQIQAIASSLVSAATSSHAYAAAGVYTLRALVEDAFGNSAQTSFSVTVAASTTNSGGGGSSGGSGGGGGGTTVTNASCTTADGVVIQSGGQITPNTFNYYAGGTGSVFYTCTNGQWYYMGKTPTGDPTAGPNYPDSTAVPR